jgi:hypothetical protein
MNLQRIFSRFVGVMLTIHFGIVGSSAIGRADPALQTSPVLPSSETRPATQPSAPPVTWDSDGTLHVGDSVVTVVLRGQMPLPEADIHRWIGTAAHAISTFYGRYPVKQVRIEVLPTQTGKVRNGVTYTGKLIRIHLGPGTRAADLDDDWMITHEMFHLAYPDLDDKYSWMEEGMADYLEPLARARIGTLTAEQVWSGYVDGMPQGQPKAGDQGLDRTHTWGRTYWGGAIFWLLADVRVREQTGNRHSIDDAFHAILDAGGDGSVHWTLDKVLEVGDRATGTSVLKDVHDEMGDKPKVIDLDALWSRLGIIKRGDNVVFDDTAPLAEIRRSMTERRGPD